MENIDMPEEIEWAKRKSNQRSIILKDLIETEELEKKAKGKLPTVPLGPKGKPLASSTRPHLLAPLPLSPLSGFVDYER